MEKVDSLHLLEHPASIQEFMKLLPTDSMNKYVDHQLAEKEKGTSELETVKTFMVAERRCQKTKQQLAGEEVATQQGPSPTGVARRSPSNPGHYAKHSPKNKSASTSHSGQQQSGPQPKKVYPFCKDQGLGEVDHE